MPAGTPTPWSYALIRLLFKFVLKIFYGSIVVENAHLIPPTGVPCVVCANHSNSLTDALLLVHAIPASIRNMLRLTAKSTQFGHRTFTSWLIESAGTVPIKRRKDYTDAKDADNTDAMAKLIEAVELGDAICLFPEGMSRYHPEIAPLKTGVARIVSDVLTRNRDKPDFAVAILTCSITYMNREHFRSDVLVTFNPPMMFTPRTHPELLAPAEPANIRSLTASLHSQISTHTFDAPSWDLIRSARLAARIYAPLGTRMSLGDWVRVTRVWLEAFKASEVHGKHNGAPAPSGALSDDEETPEVKRADDDLRSLRVSLRSYQKKLVSQSLHDSRVLDPPLLPFALPFSLSFTLATFLSLAVRTAWCAILFAFCSPGLVLWAPTFVTIMIAVHEFKKTGPMWDTFDEIAQYKLVYGLISGLLTCISMPFLVPLLLWYTFGFDTLAFMPRWVLGVATPALMWMTIRWLEDAIASARASIELFDMLRVGSSRVRALQAERQDLYGRIMSIGVDALELPRDPVASFTGRRPARSRTNSLNAGSDNGDVDVDGAQRWMKSSEKGRVRSRWESGAKYFSVRRRRKRDWGETLRLYEKVDFPNDE
ncbi:hypothetical protein CONPUDRAFT_164054 [Coniophora puteana RWD-64-598 SS2]|uniref:Phospholipid/glycerol acyltransferase domain-containing protein n=1 Tax=Coniophora puteana (strain RWD-64-598) TaxID=741705 RepID=A0A5M3MV37_CONPW|nr:uncharacterized protein CONPUDRAFT_164054 [Coniophora puteana RWD-64-598 SS2]EIW83042.1 hypothetical protein CONPUDRAFT_164054 [Coniophora puteana RWD-64-598 SS2]